MPDPLCHTAEGIAKLRELRARATPGAMTSELPAGMGKPRLYVPGYLIAEVGNAEDDDDALDRHEADSDYLAAAWNELPDSLDEIERLKEALAQLVNLKEHKDAHGKDAAYLTHQPAAWSAAKEALRR